MEISGVVSDSGRIPGERSRLFGSQKLASQSLSLYDEPPFEEISIDEFELYALDRLQLLRRLEQIKQREGQEKVFNEKLKALVKEHMPLRQSQDHFEADRRKDIISHFILRLAYSQTGDLRRWFITQECSLLKFRVDQLNDMERHAFMSTNGIDYEQIDGEEKEKKRSKLVGLSDVIETNFGNTIFYKVPFLAALPLIAKRDVYIEYGYAYVPFTKVVSLIIQRFRISLSRKLAEASTMFEYVSTDPRIGPLIKNMNKMYVGQDFMSGAGHSVDKLTADQVEAAAAVNMPLCMRHLHNGLSKEHKLKHWGRLQYGLFLKAAGLSLEDSMQFFQMHFTKLISSEDFTKKYAYTIRHMHGKEGARKDYTPYSCMKIILGSPPEVGAYHGCPYKHSSDSQLLAQLQGMKLGGPDIKEIMDLARTNNFQVACQKHFDVAHPTHRQYNIKGADNAANHPNQWFQASVDYHKAVSGKPTSSSQSQSQSSSSSSSSSSQPSSVPSSSPLVKSEIMNTPITPSVDMEIDENGVSAADIAEAEEIMRATAGRS